MRIDAGGLWLAVGASLARVVAGADGGTGLAHVVDFKMSGDNITNPTALVFQVRSGEIRSFNFMASQNIVVESVSLFDKVKGTKLGGTEIPTTSPPNDGHNPTADSANSVLQRGHDTALEAGALTPRDDPASMTVDQLSSNTWEVTLRSPFNLISRASGGFYFQVAWRQATLNSPDGESYSPAFTLTQFGVGSDEFRKFEAKFNDPSPVLAENNPSAATNTATPSTPVSSGSTSTPSSSSTSPTNPPSSLSPGAIAGIAVAGGVLLLASAALLWLLVRRRRRRQRLGDRVATATPYANDHHRRTADLIAEKEATAGVTESPHPHSPYSDDGAGGVAPHHQYNLRHHDGAPEAAAIAPHHQYNLRHHDGEAAPAAAGMMASHAHSESETAARSYTPYSDQAPAAAAAAASPGHSTHQHQQRDLATDRASTVGGRSIDGEAGTGARSATPAGRYAHLMDETMSPEERARIEAEEAHLDAAIERARQP